MENSGLEVLLPPTGDSDSGAPALSGLPDLSRPFTVLGIETSCDDTAAAVVRSDGVVLGEVRAVLNGTDIFRNFPILEKFAKPESLKNLEIWKTRECRGSTRQIYCGRLPRYHNGNCQSQFTAVSSYHTLYRLGYHTLSRKMYRIY